MITTSELIWVSVQPLIRLFLCVSAGFVLSKVGFLPVVAARSVGQILLNVALPCLMFSRIVPGFDSSNIGVLGPLVFVALLYEGIGLTMSIFIKQIFWVPHRFRYGILAAGCWGNIGDVPMAVVMSLTAFAPFNGTSDQNLAIAYLAPFLFIFQITLFSLGGANLVAMDFQGPDVADEDVQEQLQSRQRCLGKAAERVVVSLKWLFCGQRPQPNDSDFDDEKVESARQTIYSQDDPTSATPTIVQFPIGEAETKSQPPAPISLRQRLTRFAFNFLQTLAMPCSVSIIVSFIVAIVPVLKALFVADIPGVHMSSAPDGQPPLAIILNTATFMGGASVPLGLMIVGSALAKLELPVGRFRSLPLGAIGALAIARMVIMPILGVLIIQGLTRAQVLNVNDNVLRFVCIFVSCLPTATSQVVLTQALSGTGTTQHLAVFLIPQYILMFVTTTALTAFTIHLLFG